MARRPMAQSSSVISACSPGPSAPLGRSSSNHTQVPLPAARTPVRVDSACTM